MGDVDRCPLGGNMDAVGVEMGQYVEASCKQFAIAGDRRRVVWLQLAVHVAGAAKHLDGIDIAAGIETQHARLHTHPKIVLKILYDEEDLLVLYLRNVGADRLETFRTRLVACQTCPSVGHPYLAAVIAEHS